jgi:hypothetical protein
VTYGMSEFKRMPGMQPSKNGMPRTALVRFTLLSVVFLALVAPSTLGAGAASASATITPPLFGHAYGSLAKTGWITKSGCAKVSVIPFPNFNWSSGIAGFGSWTHARSCSNSSTNSATPGINLDAFIRIPDHPRSKTITVNYSYSIGAHLSEKLGKCTRISNASWSQCLARSQYNITVWAVAINGSTGRGISGAGVWNSQMGVLNGSYCSNSCGTSGWGSQGFFNVTGAGSWQMPITTPMLIHV